MRRVIRVVRTPTMMQRVTPLVRPTRALAPLDTLLVVRVLDQRGVELSGAVVRWTLVNPDAGALLRVIDARTDSLGLSRAAFVPGASAATQVVAAEVPDVGRIDFELEVPPATLRVVDAPDAIWTGDTARARAELRDLAGATLPGGSVHWGTTDSTILRVAAMDSGRARLSAGRAGVADIVAWTEGGKVQGRSRLVVRHRRIVAPIPASWRIESGSYTGSVVPIDAAAAVRRSKGGSSYWRPVPAGKLGRTILGWRESDFPLRIAFDRRRSTRRVAPDDSVAFWLIVDQLERDLGTRVFAPAELTGEDRPTGVIGVEIGSHLVEGHTFVVWNQQGDAYEGVITLRSPATMKNAGVVTHELLHLLGFGHTASWPTVTQEKAGRETRATLQDVAYAQLAMRLRAIHRASGALPGLPDDPP